MSACAKGLRWLVKGRGANMKIGEVVIMMCGFELPGLVVRRGDDVSY